MNEEFISLDFRINPNVPNEIRKEDMTPAYIVLLYELRALNDRVLTKKINRAFTAVNQILRFLDNISDIKMYEYFHVLAVKDCRGRLKNLMNCSDKVLAHTDNAITGMFRKHRRMVLLACADLTIKARTQLESEQRKYNKKMIDVIAVIAKGC